MHYPSNALDQFILHFDTALRSIFIPEQRSATRPSPADQYDEADLTAPERRQIAALLRVNHAGEVCAQALYQGQALTAQLSSTKSQMQQAAAEEIDHLAWCEQRLRELNSAPSYLNPVWYLGSLLLGMTAGLISDEWSLGFVAETEQQVTAHLASHLAQLPAVDHKTHAVLAQMQQDEATHADQAIQAGAKPLPTLIRALMRHTAKLLTTASQFI